MALLQSAKSVPHDCFSSVTMAAGTFNPDKVVYFTKCKRSLSCVQHNVRNNCLCCYHVLGLGDTKQSLGAMIVQQTSVQTLGHVGLKTHLSEIISGCLFLPHCLFLPAYVYHIFEQNTDAGGSRPSLQDAVKLVLEQSMVYKTGLGNRPSTNKQVHCRIQNTVYFQNQLLLITFYLAVKQQQHVCWESVSQDQTASQQSCLADEAISSHTTPPLPSQITAFDTINSALGLVPVEWAAHTLY